MNAFNPHDHRLGDVLRVQGSLNVDLIMVRRDDFLTCSREETASQIAKRNTDHYSYFPVIDKEGHVLGLYHAGRWFTAPAPETPIGDDFQPLSEQILIGADASIFDFIRQADTHPINLVVSESRITGLVSIYDLQKLPVRASLFALVTSFEMTMAVVIERLWKTTDEWLALISENRREKICTPLQQAKRDDAYVSDIAFTQFADKKTILCKSGIAKDIGHSETKLKLILGRIENLRNMLARANDYATTEGSAQAVCETVRDIYDLRRKLLCLVED
ncbi:MAG: CBS domain-containing protein [Donghicola eburneus]|nr:CBS domain-containing protein [Donghicola eburneus]MCI5039761.1 CBS domain-containing protein [Donghicola eburneus]